MAVDLFTDSSSSRGFSPRISFSHDLNNSDTVLTEPHIPLTPSLLNFDFDFCVSKRSFEQDSFLADELFANGVILPIQIKRKDIPIISKFKSSSSSSSLLLPLPLPNSSVHSMIEADYSKQRRKQGKDSNTNDDDSNSFWKFKRSQSFNCGRIYRRGLCSLPLLSRSKSTGSTASAKKPFIPKDEPHLKKQTSLKNSTSTHHRKPPLNKSYSGSSFSSGLVQVSPVINFTAGNLFGFRSIFSNGKDKGRKK